MGQFFTHRFSTRDGMVESICHGCFQTVGTAIQQAHVEAAEQRHACDPEQRLRFELRTEAANYGQFSPEPPKNPDAQ
jgi:hypothetical protein